MTQKNKSKIWLSSPHMGGNEQQFVQEAFDTNWVAPTGPNLVGFEVALTNYLAEESHVGVLSSGTAAIHLGLILLGVKEGDEVLVQTHTHNASVNPIVYQGANPVFIDSELDTWNICPVALEAAIIDRIAKGKKPKAIIAVHLYGMPYQVDAIKAISEKYSIPVLEDSAEALGSAYKGQKCGTFGDIGILSFNGNKIITTSGGGAIVTKNKEQKERAIFFATQARDKAPHFQHSEIGYNYRMSNICAGIGRGQMQVLEQHVALRRKRHDFYNQLFENIPGVTVFNAPNEAYESNYWLSTITINPELTNGKTKEDFRLFLEQENIESRPLWKPMHLQPIFKNALYYGDKIAETLFDKGLCLPSGSNLTLEEMERIAAGVKVFFK